MTKEEIFDFLDSAGILYEVTNHAAVYNMDEVSEIALPYPDANAKNLFVRDDKKRRYFLLTVKGNKRVNLKEFRKAQGLHQLEFASADELLEILRLTPGSVTPFGLLNDAEKKVEWYLDSYFRDKLIGCHPNDNTATVWIRSIDLLEIVKEHGNPVYLADFTDNREKRVDHF